MKKGFTLIELLVVVLIIGILSAVALPQYTASVEKARTTEALTNLDALIRAAERYYMQKEYWPENLDKLDVQVPDMKYFDLAAANTGTGWVVYATRNNNKYPYVVSEVITPGGEIQRFCSSTKASINAGSITAPVAATGKILEMCKNVSNGNDVNGKW